MRGPEGLEIMEQRILVLKNQRTKYGLLLDYRYYWVVSPALLTNNQSARSIPASDDDLESFELTAVYDDGIGAGCLLRAAPPPPPPISW